MMISSRTSLRCSISVPMGGSTAVRLSRRLLHQRIIHYHPLPCGCGHRVPFWSISIPEIAVDGGGAVLAWRRRRQHRRGLSFPKTTDAARTLSMLSSWLSVSLASLSSTRTKVWNAPRIPVVSHCHFASSASTPAGEEGLTAGHTNASLPAGVTAPSSNTGNSLPEPAHNRDARLIDFQVAAKIEGEESQIVTIQIEPGETLRAEAGNMLYMTEGVVMDTTLGGASGSAFTRFLTGQNIFLTDFTYQPEQDTQRSGKGIMALGTEFPAKLLRLPLDQLPEQSLICQRGAYLASNPTVNIEMEFTKTLTAGFFGGQGFILQRLTGVGDVIVKGGGTIVHLYLQPGESIRVSSGSIVAFERTIQYDVQMVPGIRNIMFGGEGLFLTTLTGPGRIWLQGMPADRMIAEIVSRLPSSGPGFVVPVPMGGGSGGGGGATDGGVTDDAVSPVDTGAVNNGGATPVPTNTDAATPMAESADSPEALFGDAIPRDTVFPSPTTDPTIDSNTSFDQFGDDQEFASSNDDFMAGSDTAEFASSTTEDENLIHEEGTMQGEDDWFASTDDTKIEGLGSSMDSNAVTGGDDGPGLIKSIWDFFMGDD